MKGVPTQSSTSPKADKTCRQVHGVLKSQTCLVHNFSTIVQLARKDPHIIVAIRVLRQIRPIGGQTGFFTKIPKMTEDRRFPLCLVKTADSIYKTCGAVRRHDRHEAIPVACNLSDNCPRYGTSGKQTIHNF